MASGGYEDGSEAFSHPHPPPPLFSSTSIGQEVSGSWMNLSGSVEQHECRLLKRASDIMPILKLKLAILSGGRDDQGRVIVTFPVRPRGTQYDHAQLLQTIQYLSTVPSIEAQELGFVLVVDGRLLSWSDVKMILRTAQEALPGQVHVAYIIQSNQFVQKQQISMGLSKEKDKVEFSIVKVSSVEKLVRHIDQRQVTFDMSGSLKYSHEEWLKLRTITEGLLDAYQEYISNASQLETQLKPSSAMSPERLSDLQIEMGRLESIQLNIQSADTKVVQLCDSLKTEIETNSGSSGLTPEMVNCLATVTRISQNTEQQQKSLKDLCEQSHRKLGQLFSLKQFELGLAKVKQWIKNKGMDKALRVDIGDSIPKVLSIQDDLKKLESKAEAVATDVAEIRRIADIMAASDHYAKDSVKERLKKMNSKYSKFKSALEKRRLIVTTSVAMFKGINEWRQLYDEHTTEWNSTNSLKCTESAKELLSSLESQYSHLKELAQSVLTQGQELVKCLKSSGISQGDPDFRKSLRFISRVTEEVTEKLRRCQETTAIRRARLDQYVQLLVCERDGKEGIKSLQGILQNLEASHGGVGTSLETVTSISTEVEQHEEEVKRTHEYAKQLLQVAFQQREQLGDKDLDRALLTELNDLASLINGIITKLKHRLDLSRKLFCVFEPTQVTVKQWMKLAASKLPNESFVKEIKEKKGEVLSSLRFCKDMSLQLQELLKEPSSNNTVTNPSVNESSRHLNEVLSMIEAQEQQLCTDLENKKLSIDQAGKLKSIEQSIEDILIWLREYGLSQFAEFLTLGFTLATVQDQWTEFCAFRETCQGLTHQVDELEKSIQKEGEEKTHHEEMLVKTSKRVSDLNRVWRRFLIRVQNREKVLTSLHQFLLESVKLASVMSEMVKSTDFQEKQSALQSSYHLTVDQGKRLVVLLKDSPDGSQDSQIADKVAARMKHLTDLYQQIQPLITSTSSASNDTVLQQSEHNSVTSVNDSQTHQMRMVNEDTTVSAGDTVAAKLSPDKKVEETVEDMVIDDVFESESVIHKSDENVPKTAKDIFEEAEAVITMLIEEFLISVMEFMQSHDVFPSQPDKVDQELTQHDKFLDRKRIDVEDLKNRVTSLRAYAQHANVPENRIDHIVMRVGNKLPGRISLFERRLIAFRKFSQLCMLRKKCVDLRAEFDTFFSESSRGKVHDKDVQVLLKACISHLKQLESLTLQCSTLSRDFTEISSEIEMRGVDARKTMRQIRQDIEEFSYNYNYSLNRRKKMLEASVQVDDIGIKFGELMQWISDTGIPFINTITYGKSCEETHKCVENFKAMNSKRESISAEIIAVTEVVESVDTSLTSLNQSKELKLANTELQKLFTSKCQVLEATEQYFASADALIYELQTAMSPREHSVQALNPLVVDKLYTTLNAQAEHVCRSLNAAKGTNIQSTVESVGERLSQAEKLTNKYLLSCSCDSHDDIATVFSLLDNLLFEIQNDVQEAINAVTGKEELKEVKKTPVKQTLKISSRISSSTTPEKSPRKGTVSNLKKLFESGSKPSEPQSPVNQSTNTYSPKRRLSTSTLLVDWKLPAQLVSESKPDDEKPKAQSETTSVSMDTRSVDSPVNDGVVIVKTKEAPLHSAITVNITSLTNYPPPIPPLPPAEEPPKRPPPPLEPSDIESDSLPPTPPPIRPPPPLQSDESSQDPFEPIREPVYEESTLSQFQKIDDESAHDHDVLSNPSTQEPHSSYYTSEESQCDPSSCEHTPRVLTPQEVLNDNSQFDNEHFERYYPEEPIDSSLYDNYLGDTSSDVYSSQNGHYSDRVINLKMEDSIRHRDLSPVIEEADEDDLIRDHPDIGWKKDKVDKKKDLEWSRAHKQSLLSMKAIINDFYQDEVIYTDTLSRLLKVYVPILQHTGIFNTMYPIVEFQQVFLTQLSHSITTIPELCVCFQQNLENFKLYFPFVLGYDTALKIITNINPDELSSLLPLGSKSSESDMIQGYTAPYHRIEIYCSLFQHLLRAAFKEDLMNLAALSETLECLLDLLRILAMELATTKLTGCPFHVSAADVVAMNPFLVHLANKVKEVYLYTVFLHPEALVISERLLDESKEHTVYAYIMHIPISGMILVENFHGLVDRFAVCEKGQVATQNFVVFRSCEDTSVKDYWVNQLKILLQKDNACLTPRETLQPEQVEQISSLLPTTAPPPPGASNRLDPLRRKKSLKRQRKEESRDDLIDGYDTPESPAIENVYRVTMDHRTSGPLANEYLNVMEGDLVEVLEIKGNNYYVAKFSVNLSSEEEEEEGFVPACCLEPLVFKEGLNHNSNNNANPQNFVKNSRDECTAVNEDDLHRDWTVFCLRTGRTEPFPDCSSEQELLNAKMDSLVKYYSDQHQLLGLSSHFFKDTTEDSVDGNTVRSDAAQEPARRLLYRAEFLGPVLEEEPSCAQLDGVFSLRHPYAAIEYVTADNEGQICLRKGQLVTVLDSKKDDWWLVSTFPEGNVAKREGWAKRELLQHAEYIREDVAENSNSTSPFSIQLWLTLAKYQATDEGTISINEGELVEVIDNSRNKWSLVRTLGRQPREGWIPTEYITPYNFSENDLPCSPISPGISVHPSIRVDDSISSNEGGHFDFTNPISPTLSVGEYDSEEKRKEALEQRDCTLEELYASEREYVDRLGYCITNYKEQIEAPNSSVPKTLKLIVTELFTNIKEIHKFHKEEVLPRIANCQDNPTGLVDLFSFANSQLKTLYVTYCKGQKKSESVLKEHSEYFEELRSKLKDRLNLRDYLILPIQRITKYNLLLKNVHEFSVKAGCTIPHFQTALGAAQEISRQANNAVHMSMIEGAQKRIAEFGKLVLQDVFEFAEQTAKGHFKQRRVFLFEKAVLVAKSRKDTPDRECYAIRDTFLLNEISLGEDHFSDKKNIVIYEMISGNKFILKATTLRCHEEWLKKANELASLSKKLTLASNAIQGIYTGRSRSMSEPLDIPPFALPQGGTSSPSELMRQGSQRLRRSARHFNRPHSARKVENFDPGTRFIVMERIVPQGGEEFELEPGEEVELIKMESNGLLTICTIDTHRFTGSVPPGYLRDKELVKDNMNTAPKVTVLLNDLEQYLYDSIPISCAFNGFPEPDVEWRRNGKTIVNSDRIKISSCATSSVLEISDLQYTDEGEYVCILTNELGEDSTSMDLYIEGPPLPPSKPVASRVTPTSVKLKWNPPEHDGHSMITSYVVEQLKEGFGEWQAIVQQPRTVFVVKTLNPNTWYQFRVIAISDNGESRASEPSEIVSTTKGKVPFMSPATKRKLILEDSTSKGFDETDTGMTREVVSQSYASQEDLTTMGLPSSTDELVNYQMIRHASVGSLYDLLPDELGRGRFGILHRCVNKNNGAIFCAKYLKQTELAMKEVKTLHGLCRGKMCDNLVQWIDALSTEANVVIIMEFMEGGEIIDYILKRENMTEGVVVSYLKQLLNALDYIHEKKVIHCDIKPENIVMTGDDPPVLKLVDFGSAHTDQSQSTLTISTLAHSLEFCAPELINKHTVTTFADMWSVGVLTYILLSGMSPFFVESTQVLMQKVTELCYDFNHSDFHQVSPEAKDFIAMILKRNPTQRMSAPNALQHGWIKTLGEAFGRCSTWPMPKIDMNKLKVFHARRKLQTSVIATRASSVFKSKSHSSSTVTSPVPSIVDVIHTSLDMIESPPILEEGTEEVQAPINANITLEWVYTGFPIPSVVWEHKQRKVTSSGRVEISSEHGLTRLSISGVVKSDEGIYTCCALNNLGSDVQECRVVVLDSPSAPYSVTGVLLEATSALVSWCKPVSSGNSPITHFVLEARQIDYDQWDLVDNEVKGMAHVINDLLPGATYIFRIAAVNCIGPSVFSKPSLPVFIHDEANSRSESPYMFSEITMKKLHVNIEYDVLTEIGRGIYSVVYECIERSTDRNYAAKCVPKEFHSHALSEFECLRKLNHPRVVKLEEAYDMPDQTVLILEYIPDGELICLVSPLNPLNETTAAKYIRHIAEGLQYLHDQGFIHACLSPKHLLLTAGRTEIKIAGFSHVLTEEATSQLESFHTLPQYCAPEVIQMQPVSSCADMWSVGAIILFMLTGYAPFSASDSQQLIQYISTVSVSSDCNDSLSSLSDDCYDIVFRGLLTPNPRKRLTSHQCQRHRWLQNIGTGTVSVDLESSEHTGNNRNSLKHMNTEEQVQYFMTKYQTVLQSPTTD